MVFRLTYQNGKTMSVGLVMLLVLAMLPAFVCGEPVGQEVARRKAATFLSGRAQARDARATDGQQLSVAYTSDEYHVFNCGQHDGFVIVSGDDCAPDILGYSDSGRFDEATMPDNMRGWMKGYKEQIRILRANGVKYTARAKARSTDNKASISPLLTSKWDQGDPYNKHTPLVNGEHCVTGCVATAMAQIMYYWYKETGFKSTLNMDIPEYIPEDNKYPTLGILHAPFAFDWANMTDVYNSNSSYAEKQAVAQLMEYCGYGVRMKYGTDESGAYSHDCSNAFKNYFGYKTSTNLFRNKYTYEKWQNLIYNELANGRPVYYAGDNSNCGHAFVCDGYDHDDYFHINWGWSGNSNGNFKLSLLNPKKTGIGGGASSDGYSMSQDIIICHPTEVIEPSAMPQQANFNAKIACRSIDAPNLAAGYELGVGVTLENIDEDPAGRYYNNNVIVVLEANGQKCQQGLNVLLSPHETLEVIFPLMISANVAGDATLSVYQYYIDDQDKNLLKRVNLTVSQAPLLWGNASVYRNDNTLWYKLSGLISTIPQEELQILWGEVTVDDELVPHFKWLSSDETYELQESDLGKTIMLRISCPSYRGYVNSSPLNITRLANYDEPTPPQLTISQNMVCVKNARTTQEYLIFDFQKPIITLSEEDWKNSKKPKENGEFYIGGTNNSVNYVYTRYKAKGYYLAGSIVERSNIHLGDETKVIKGISLKVEKVDEGGTYSPIIDKENGAYYVKVGDVIRITASPLPSTATFYGIATSRWINNKVNGYQCGGFYANKECTQELTANQNYTQVFYKVDRQMNFNEVIAEYVSGGYNSVYSDRFYLHAADDKGNWILNNIDTPGTTIGAGEKRDGIPLRTYPLRATLSNVLFLYANLISSEGTPPTIAFNDEDHTMSVDATNATPGTYYFEMYQYGVKQNKNACVIVTAPAVEGVEIIGEGIETTRGKSFKVGMLLMPANAEAETTEWSVDDESIATITDEGVITVKADAPLGVWTKIRVTVDGKFTATCNLFVTKPSPTLFYDDFLYEVVVDQPQYAAPILYNPQGLTVRYYSMDEQVATVDQSTGTVTLKGVGQTFIFAVFGGNDNYDYGEAGYMLAVYPRGDVNKDYMLNQTDVQHTVQRILGNPPAGFFKDAADIDHNGYINAADVVLMIKEIKP